MKQKYGLEKFQIKMATPRVTGNSGIGVVVVGFLFFILILLPLVLHVYEIKSAQETVERARLAAEISASEMILELQAPSLSERHFEWSESIHGIYLNQITQKFKELNIKGEIEALKLSSSLINEKPSLKIYFKWKYVPTFLQNEFYKRYIEVNYVYEFPIL